MNKFKIFIFLIFIVIFSIFNLFAQPIAMTIGITSSPTGAKVTTANGRLIGITPFTSQMTIRETYVLNFTKEGYYPQTFTYVCNGNPIHVTLQASSGQGPQGPHGNNNKTLTVNSNVNNAAVFINGAEKGRTPCALSLPKGNYNVLVRHQGYTDYSVTVNLNRDKTVNAVLNPMIRNYTLMVNSNVNNATVFINNIEKGKTPCTILLPAGTYAVLVKAPGHREYSISINLASDMTINADLTRTKYLKINLPGNARVWIDGVMQAVQPGINIFYSDSDVQHNIKIQYFDLIFEDRIPFTGNEKELNLVLDLKNFHN